MKRGWSGQHPVRSIPQVEEARQRSGSVRPAALRQEDEPGGDTPCAVVAATTSITVSAAATRITTAAATRATATAAAIRGGTTGLAMGSGGPLLPHARRPCGRTGQGGCGGRLVSGDPCFTVRRGDFFPETRSDRTGRLHGALHGALPGRGRRSRPGLHPARSAAPAVRWVPRHSPEA
jgi:hypothetical protein